MIEMLAVLAIIGVLSVAAVAGLMWAFAKYKANNTIHDVHLWELATLDSQQLYEMTSGELVLNELGEVSTHGYPMAIMVQDENVFYISVDDVPKRVCSLTLDMVEEPMIVTVNGVSYTGSDICDTDTNQMLFYYNKYMGDVDNSCIPACPSGETCCGGVCKQIETPCGSNGCLDCGSKYCTNSNTCCDNPNATKCGSNDCCEGNCCNGTCCPSLNMVCEHNVCKCYGDLIWNEENATCVCPTGYSGPFEDGSCKRLHCDPPYCYLNNDLCGYDCDDKAESCFFGTCWPQECPVGTSLQHTLFGKYITGGYYWGCQIDNTHCFTRRLGVDFYCLDDSNMTQTACCRSDNAGNCIKGICNDEKCPANGQKVIIEQVENLVGCQYENNINCIPTKYENDHPSIWTCFRSGLECSTNCKNPPECDGECLQVQCPEGTTLQNGMCCKANLCCDYQTNECFIDGKRCGFSCPATRDFADCTTGNCLNKCSTTSTWAYDSTFDLYTCQKDNFSCYNWLNQPQETPICYLNGNKCGSKCSYDATNCQNVFMEECAKDITYKGKTKKACIYHKSVTETCFCDTDLDTPVGTLCCPTGHVIENGACSIPI